MRTFRLGEQPGNAPARRRFRLAAPAPVEAPRAPAPAIDLPYIPRAWGVGFETSAPAPAAPTVKAQTTQAGAYIVRAPVPARKGRRVLTFTAATSRDVPAFMGTMRLLCTPEAVDLERLRLGVLSLCVDHVSSLIIGRVTSATIGGGRLDMRAEISESAYARRIVAEIDDLTRPGFSPGFLVNSTEPLPESDPAYDPKQFMQIVVTNFTPYECSSTAVPRNPLALIQGEASMNAGKNLDPNMAPPALAPVDDEIGLGLSAGRLALKSGQGSARQRRKLSEFFRVYDDARDRGDSRDTAAHAAKQAAGLA